MEKIGLEIHGYIDTNEKLFCSCKRKALIANTNICPICTGSPGNKPLLPNSEALKKSIQISLMLNTKINTFDKKNLVWQRKHYSWADLPKGYQNTLSGTYAAPIGEKGKFEGIGITEVHLEEDPASWDPQTGKIDYNRSGAPLIEIVTEPEFTSSEQVASWLKYLIQTLSYVKALDKESGIKADVNVNIAGKTKRTEIKNVNSISEIKNAINSELERHKKTLPQTQETRRWNPEKKKTELMRTKEQAADYRFISDPDLPSIFLNKNFIENVKKNLPETPKQKLEKLIKKYHLEKKDAEILAKNIDLVDFFESFSKEVDAKKHISWITVELLRVLNYNKKSLDEVNILPQHVAELIKSIDKKEITVLKAKQTLNEFIPNSFSIKSKNNISQISQEEIEKICMKVINENKKAVDDFLKGEKNSLNFLIGQVMKMSNRRADFKKSKEIIEKKLLTK